MLSEIANQKIYTLIPKDKDNLFSKITLTFIHKEIRQMQLADHLGHVTLIGFSKVKTDVNLPNALFTFTPGPKVDVIDETLKR